MRRSLILAATALALTLGLGLVGVPAAGADPSPLTSSVDKIYAHPGDTVTLTVTFTNHQTVPVTFSYLSVNPIYATWSSDVEFAMTSCTGEIDACWFGQPEPLAAFIHPTSPIAPGDSRTATITYEIDAESPCGHYIGFFFYIYRESSAGAVADVPDGPDTMVECS